MNRDLLISDLTKVLKKHKVWASGSVKLRDISEWDVKTASASIKSENGFYPQIDTCGPFLDFDISPLKKAVSCPITKSAVQVLMKDKLLENGVVSPLDGKSAFHNRRTWNEHLKANGCVEIGNDYNNKKPSKEIHGDFDCRKELAQAVNQVAEKYGH